jgi:hypothetical protein
MVLCNPLVLPAVAVATPEPSLALSPEVNVANSWLQTCSSAQGPRVTRTSNKRAKASLTINIAKLWQQDTVGLLSHTDLSFHRDT